MEIVAGVFAVIISVIASIAIGICRVATHVDTRQHDPG
jgi:hypothetical protein